MKGARFVFLTSLLAMVFGFGACSQENRNETLQVDDPGIDCNEIKEARLWTSQTKEIEYEFYQSVNAECHGDHLVYDRESRELRVLDCTRTRNSRAEKHEVVKVQETRVEKLDALLGKLRGQYYPAHCCDKSSKDISVGLSVSVTRKLADRELRYKENLSTHECSTERGAGTLNGETSKVFAEVRKEFSPRHKTQE